MKLNTSKPNWNFKIKGKDSCLYNDGEKSLEVLYGHDDKRRAFLFPLQMYETWDPPHTGVRLTQQDRELLKDRILERSRELSFKAIVYMTAEEEAADLKLHPLGETDVAANIDGSKTISFQDAEELWSLEIFDKQNLRYIDPKISLNVVLPWSKQQGTTQFTLHISRTDLSPAALEKLKQRLELFGKFYGMKWEVVAPKLSLWERIRAVLSKTRRCT